MTRATADPSWRSVKLPVRAACTSQHTVGRLVATGLILPRRIAEGPPLVLRCTMCTAAFDEDHAGDFMRHVRHCSERNEDRILAKVAQREGNYFTSPADKERYEHFRKGGRS